MNPSVKKETMRPADLFLYLIGNRAAIHRIAATPWSWIVGAVLVLTAGLARNYDHLHLLSQAEWFIGPFAASLFSIIFIYIWVALGIRIPKSKTRGKNLLTFLNLFWLTAPCAWIYGIPVELFTDLVTATKWNIAFLAIVSLWRVAIIIRAVTILTEAPWPRVALFIIAPAALEMMVGSFYKELSLVGIMGGVRLPPHDELLRQATAFTASASFWIFIASIIAMFFTKGRAKNSLCHATSGFPKTCLLLATASLLIWVLIAIPFQPAIKNRQHLAQLVWDDQYEAAIAFASSKQRDDFPTIHYLPPDPTVFSYTYPLDFLEKLPANAPAWLRKEWTENAIEAHKSFMTINPETLLHIKTRHPEIYAALLEYEKSIKSKHNPTPDESRWLSEFQAYLAEPPFEN